MAAWTPGGLRRAARMADGWIADPVQSLPVIKEFAERYRTEAAKIGRTPYICLMRDAVIAESLEKAAAKSAPTMVTHRFYFKYGAYVPDEYLKNIKGADDLTSAVAAKNRIVPGSPNHSPHQLHICKEHL